MVREGVKKRPSVVFEGELAVIAFLRAFLIIFGIKKPVTESRAFCLWSADLPTELG